MITIPVAVAIPHFKWQISFFQHQHFKVYGEEAKNKALIPIINRNHFKDKPVHSVDWNLKLPYVIVDSVLDMYSKTESMYIPTNCYTALKQVLQYIDDEEHIELCDSDMPHIKPYTGGLPGDNEIYADARYEPWHMFISTPEGKNREIINKYLKHSDEGYMNGGSNIIAKVSTMKKIIDEVIEVGMSIADEYPNTNHSWWQSMYAINVACHNNRIKMIDSDSCYYPNVNELDINKHHIVHYSCDPLFKKSDFPNIDITKFPDNVFYNSIKDWLYNA